MMNNNDISGIMNRIASGKHTDEDIAILCQVLLSGDDRQLSIQLGKYNVNITEGKEIHIGDRIYQQWDKEAMEALVKTIQETSGIHQNTQGGDAAGRDIDKRNVYENCTFIQLFTQHSKLSSFSQESFQDLDWSGIPSESIQKAYQDSLPPDADVWNLPHLNADVSDLAGDNIATVLKKLNEFRQLSQFFERLSQDENLPVEIRSLIANKFASKKPPQNSKNKSSADFLNNRSNQLKSYLIATLNPDERERDLFLLNAWLIVDDSDSVQDLSKFQSLLDPNEQQTGKLCRLTQISTELDKFLKKALRHLKGERHLTIEFFLPSDLMCMEIDRWKISNPVDKDGITLGIKYPIRLRSLERLDRDYLDSYLSQWRDCWDKVRDNLHSEILQELFEHLQEMESFKWQLLRNKLNGKIGLKVTCSYSKYIRKDLFKAILQATTPIAIWTRTDIANLDRLTEIDKILTFKPLCHLSESVRLTREQADAQTEEHLGHHLALLWENPYRLPPVTELNSPGQ